MRTRLTEELSVLAATRAALDPARSGWQHDILVSTIIEVLARKGPLTQRELQDHLDQTWIARATSSTLLTSALETAQEQDLLEFVQGRKGRRRWSITEAVRAEATADRDWAQSILAELATEVRSRLENEFPSSEDIGNRAPRLTKELIQAMVEATRGVFQAVQESTSPQDLREVRLNLRSVIPKLRSRVQPSDLADFVAELALAAADPDDHLGNDVLRAIVAGQILHGMVCRADVAAPPPPTKLVLDTSQLLTLASHEAKVVDLFKDFLSTAQAQGCELIVTDRVLDEWENHWKQADDQEQKMRQRYGNNALEVLKLTHLYALTAYAYAASENPSLQFANWAAERRRIRPVLNRYGVRVIDSAAEELDSEFVNDFSSAIEQSIEESGRVQMRGARRRETDAMSAAIVRAFRTSDEQTLIPSAWFVARDRHSDEAYRTLVGDDFPLAVTARSWLLYYSMFDPVGERESRAQLADRVSQDLILEAFISVASAYTPDEMLELGDLLSEGDHLERDDVRAAVRSNFLNPDRESTDRTKDLARARVLRQSDRAMRARELEGKRVREQQRKIDVAEAKIEQLQNEVRSRGTTDARLRRIIEVLVVGGVALVGLILASLLHWLQGTVLVLVWLVFVVLGPLEAYKYVTDQRSRTRYIIEGVSALGLSVLVLILDNQFQFGRFLN